VSLALRFPSLEEQGKGIDRKKDLEIAGGPRREVGAASNLNPQLFVPFS
jgi:hypothetical protein